MHARVFIERQDNKVSQPLYLRIFNHFMFQNFEADFKPQNPEFKNNHERFHPCMSRRAYTRSFQEAA